MRNPAPVPPEDAIGRYPGQLSATRASQTSAFNQVHAATGSLTFRQGSNSPLSTRYAPLYRSRVESKPAVGGMPPATLTEVPPHCATAHRHLPDPRQRLTSLTNGDGNRASPDHCGTASQGPPDPPNHPIIRCPPPGRTRSAPVRYRAKGPAHMQSTIAE